MIGEAGPSEKEHKTKYNLQVKSRLFDILTDQSEVNHPLCEECSDYIIDQMDSNLRHLEDECKDYREYVESLEKKKQREGAQSDEALAAMQQHVDTVESQEEQLLKRLEEFDAVRRQLAAELEQEEQELERVNKEEDNYWQEYNNLKRQFFISEDELQSVNNQLRYRMSQVDKLKRTNVFNATFHIWCEISTKSTVTHSLSFSLQALGSLRHDQRLPVGSSSG